MRRLERLAGRAGRGGGRGQRAKSRRGWRRLACLARVYGREKHPYSIWRKLQRKSIGFSQLSDIYAFRVLVATRRRTATAPWAPCTAPGPACRERFKDFISTPKRNNYRSLHTTVVGPKGMRIEMQIRTEAMDRVAEDGVAAHWRYKDRVLRLRQPRRWRRPAGATRWPTCATWSRCWNTAATPRTWSNTPSWRCSSTRCSSSRPRAG